MATPLGKEHVPAVLATIAQFKSMFGNASTERVEAMVQAFLHGKTKFFDIPGLEQPDFFDPSSSPEAQAIVTEVRKWLPALQRDAHQLLSDTAALPIYSHHQLEQSVKTWKSFEFFRGGSLTAQPFLRCPTSAAIICKIAHNLNTTGDTIFSILGPGTEITPHRDMSNYAMSLHIGITIPPDCGIAVGDEQRAWKEAGEVQLFNYSSIHSAWNRSDSPRVVLICDIWRPEITQAERLLLTALGRLVQAARASAQAASG